MKIKKKNTYRINIIATLFLCILSMTYYVYSSRFIGDHSGVSVERQNQILYLGAFFSMFTAALSIFMIFKSHNNWLRPLYFLLFLLNYLFAYGDIVGIGFQNIPK